MEPPIQPDPIPTPSNPAKLQTAGVIGAAILLSLFVGSWVARGIVERKVPSFWEVGFAGTSAVSLLTDPKAAINLPLKFLDRK